MSKKGKLTNAEKEQILAKAGDDAAIKRLAKKLDRSVETLTNFLAAQAPQKEAVVEEPVVQTATPAPVDKPSVVDMWGNAKAPSKEMGVVVATERSSSRVDAINKKLGHNTAESIIKRRPDCTARIR